MPPLAKRLEERRRRNAVPGETTVQVTGVVDAPNLPTRPRPHPVAVAWYESLKVSGQAQFYEPGDWAAAVYVVTSMTKMLRARDMNAAAFAAVWTAMGDLLTTEASRRRARVFIQRVDSVDEPDGKPTAMDEYRKMVGA